VTNHNTGCIPSLSYWCLSFFSPLNSKHDCNYLLLSILNSDLILNVFLTTTTQRPPCYRATVALDFLIFLNQSGSESTANFAPKDGGSRRRRTPTVQLKISQICARSDSNWGRVVGRCSVKSQFIFCSEGMEVGLRRFDVDLLRNDVVWREGFLPKSIEHELLQGFSGQFCVPPSKVK